MKKLFYMLVAVLITSATLAQTETRIAKTVKGKVVNEATNDAVAYTNVGIEDTFYGTASDDEGNFLIKIPEEMIGSNIFFSSVGYKSLKVPVSSLFEKEFNIVKLVPQTYDIEKVDIAGRSMVLARILRMASENTPYNFISGPFNLVCSLNREKSIGDSVQVSEHADVLIYDKTGYRSPSKTDAYKMRTFTLEKDTPDYSFSTSTLNMDELLELDWVRNASSVLNPSLSSQFELELVSETVVDGNPAWVISFRQENPTPEGSQDYHATAFEGKITIFKDDYSVKMIEGSVKSKMHNRQGKHLAVAQNNLNFYEDVSYHFTVTYSKLKPEQLSMNKTYLHNGQQVKESTQIAIDSVLIENVRSIAQRYYFAE